MVSSARIPASTVAAWAGTLVSSLIDFIDDMHAGDNPREARFDLIPVYRVAIFLKTIPAYLSKHGFERWEDIKSTIDDVVDAFINSMAVIAMYRSVLYIGCESFSSFIKRRHLLDTRALPKALSELIDAMMDVEANCSGLLSIWPSLRDPTNLVRLFCIW